MSATPASQLAVADKSGQEKQRGAYGKLYCREHPEVSIAIYRNGPGRFCIARRGGTDRKTGDRRTIEQIAEARLAELHQEAGLGKLDCKFGIMRSFPSEKTSAGGARRYAGQSPFKEFDEVIHPRKLIEAEEWTYFQMPHWLAASPIPNEWKIVLAYMMNDARNDGVFRSGPAAVAKGVGLSLNGAKGIMAHLESYKLTSPFGEGYKGSIAYRFHRVAWMTTHQPRWRVNHRAASRTHQPDCPPPTNPVTATHQPGGGHSIREKKKTNPESAREQTKPPAGIGIQEKSAEKESERFARSTDAVPDDPLWGSLCRTVGLVEMTQNGASWLKRYRLCRDALAVAVRDFLSMTPQNQRSYNPAAYITTAFENEKRKFG